MLVNRFDKFDFGTPKIGTVDSSNTVQPKRIEMKAENTKEKKDAAKPNTPNVLLIQKVHYINL